MAKPSKKVVTRMIAGLKKFQPILDSAKGRDINESDTSIIVSDMLSEMFGYDRYTEITREHAIRGTYCDLAIQLEGKLSLLIEVKAIGVALQSKQIKQAVDYGVNSGLEWVVLTNGIHWKIFRITYGKPIETECLIDIDVSSFNPRKQEAVTKLFVLCREGFAKDALAHFSAQRKALDRHTIGAIIQSDEVLKVIRRELRKISPDVAVSTEEIEKVIESEVLKREVIEGEDAEAAQKVFEKATKKRLRQRRQSNTETKSKAEPG